MGWTVPLSPPTPRPRVEVLIPKVIVLGAGPPGGTEVK